MGIKHTLYSSHCMCLMPLKQSIFWKSNVGKSNNLLHEYAKYELHYTASLHSAGNLDSLEIIQWVLGNQWIYFCTGHGMNLVFNQLS